jgi:hypothetical protein
MIRTATAAALAAITLYSVPALAADPMVTCEAGKLKISASYASCRLKAEATAVNKATSPDYSKCDEKFDDKFPATEVKAENVCPSLGDQADIKTFLTACTNAVAEGLATDSLIDDPVTCAENLATCEDDLAAASLCGLRGVGGTWTLNLPDAVPSPDTCALDLLVTSATTVNSTIYGCGYLGGASATGALGSNTATAVQDASPICSGYRLESTLTFTSCTSGNGTYQCLTGPGGSVVFSGTMTVSRS